MSDRDWVEWHDRYEQRASFSRRLEVVQQRIRESLDRAPAGPIRVVSICAGQGRDLIGALVDHPRRGDVTARLVELDEHNVEAARAGIQEAGLDGITVIADDASRTDVYLGAVPADIVLVCGVFGNITLDDISRTIDLLPQLCARNATVIWTRQRPRRLSPLRRLKRAIVTRRRRKRDMTARIRRWFTRRGFEELEFDAPAEYSFSVGVNSFRGDPRPLESGTQLFTFVGFDRLKR